MKTFFLSLLLCASVQGAKIPTIPKTSLEITLAWDAVDVATGYNLYYGTQSKGYTNSVYTCTNEVSISLTNFQAGTTYYFAATSLLDGLETDFSDEISYIPIDIPPAVISFLFSLKLQETDDLKNWVDSTNLTAVIPNNSKNKSFRIVGPLTIQKQN